MPVGEYYGGKGRKVMRAMKDQYGGKKGERVFYATAKKRGKKGAGKKKKANNPHPRGKGGMDVRY